MKTKRFRALTLPVCAALALVSLTLPSLISSAAAQSRAEIVAWQYAVLRRSSGSSAGYSLLLDDKRMTGHRNWGSLLKEMLGRRTDTDLTRDADELTVIDYLGGEGWELISTTERARMRDGTSTSTERSWTFKRSR